jgi:hypothetical protein
VPFWWCVWFLSQIHFLVARAHVVSSPFPTLATAVPFSNEVVEAERRDPQYLNHASLTHAAAVLRTKLWPWSRLTRAAPGRNLGAFCVELSVIRMADGATVNVAATKQETKALFWAAHKHLCNTVTPDVAHVLSTRLVQHTAELNHVALTMLLRAATSEGVATVTLRAVIKDINTMQVGMKNTAVWFPTAHTNAIVLNTHTHTVSVLEPSLSNCLPGVVDNLRRLVPPGFTVLETNADHEAPIVDLVLCTVGAAVQALAVIFNPVRTQEELNAIVHWVHCHQHWLIRMLVRAVGDLGPSPPRQGIGLAAVQVHSSPLPHAYGTYAYGDPAYPNHLDNHAKPEPKLDESELDELHELPEPEPEPELHELSEPELEPEPEPEPEPRPKPEPEPRPKPEPRPRPKPKLLKKPKPKLKPEPKHAACKARKKARVVKKIRVWSVETDDKHGEVEGNEREGTGFAHSSSNFVSYDDWL